MTPDEQAWIDYVQRQMGDDAAEIARLQILATHRRALLNRAVKSNSAADTTGLDSNQGRDYDPHYTGGLADPPDPID